MVDGGHIGKDHHEPVHSQRDAGRIRHMTQCRKESLGHGVYRFPRLTALLLLNHEPFFLFKGIGQLREGIGQLDTGDVKLKSFSKPGRIPL